MISEFSLLSHSGDAHKNKLKTCDYHSNITFTWISYTQCFFCTENGEEDWKIVKQKSSKNQTFSPLTRHLNQLISVILKLRISFIFRHALSRFSSCRERKSWDRDMNAIRRCCNCLVQRRDSFRYFLIYLDKFVLKSINILWFFLFKD
jgi:hypothetical protein